MPSKITDLLWSSSGGTGVFDVYSVNHIVCFISLTLILYNIFKHKTWIVCILLTIGWEVLEGMLSFYLPIIPLVGQEAYINKVVGDPISNLIGFSISMYFIKRIENEK